MNVLFCGRGKGSWLMRGVQIGAALGARVLTDPNDEDIAWADVVVLVKKYAVDYAARVHKAGKPIIWDALDFWMQPAQNGLDIKAGLVAFHQMKHHIKPVAVICATQQMAADCGGVYIPHHCRIGLTPTPPREKVRTVAYEGSERYLGKWDLAIREQCHLRGWDFEINPKRLTDADILVAFRDGVWDGPICRAWKSGIKYINAICAGRPILSQFADAANESLPVRFICDELRDLSNALDSLELQRFAAHEDGLERAHLFRVDVIAAKFYQPLLERVASEVPCTAA